MPSKKSSKIFLAKIFFLEWVSQIVNKHNSEKKSTSPGGIFETGTNFQTKFAIVASSTSRCKWPVKDRPLLSGWLLGNLFKRSINWLFFIIFTIMPWSGLVHWASRPAKSLSNVMYTRLELTRWDYS